MDQLKWSSPPAKADLRWCDASDIVHHVEAINRGFRTFPSGRDRIERVWRTVCRSREFNERFPPAFAIDDVTCLLCLAGRNP